MSSVSTYKLLSHEHLFIGTTKDEIGHSHSFSGVTGPEIHLPDCSELGHIHLLHVTHCSFLNLHIHNIKGITGPAVWISEKEHYHILTGSTAPSAADWHSHTFSGTTKVISTKKPAVF